MSRQITVKSYQRSFRRPLRTARGEWALRKGFLLRVEQDGQDGYGEVAPIPEFGTETVSDAADFLQQLVREPDLEVPPSLPCCAFGLSAARSLKHPPLRAYAVSALLPAGVAALSQAVEKVAVGYCSLKWKIGIEPLTQELALARDLLESLPTGVRLRLDANACLTTTELEQWLGLLLQFPQQVDYLEQPLACGEEATMARFMQESGVTIALDESLNGEGGTSWLKPGAWAGPLVIKAALMGEVDRLATKLAPVASQLVLSSVFETSIGLENSLRLVDALPQLTRPIGFDTLNTFDDGWQALKPSPLICVRARSNYSPESIWNSI